MILRYHARADDGPESRCVAPHSDFQSSAGGPGLVSWSLHPAVAGNADGGCGLEWVGEGWKDVSWRDMAGDGGGWQMSCFQSHISERVGVACLVTASRDLSHNPPQNTLKQEFARGMLQNRAHPLRPLEYCAEWHLLTFLVNILEQLTR
jgi:hypothetical protein